MTLCHPLRIKLVPEWKRLYGVKPLRLREKRGGQCTSMRRESVRSAKAGNGEIRLRCGMSPTDGLIPISEDLVRLGDVFLRTGEAKY